MSQTEFTMTLNLTAIESERLERLSTVKELTKSQVVRQALKLYELLSDRSVVIVDPKDPQKRQSELLLL